MSWERAEREGEREGEKEQWSSVFIHGVNEVDGSIFLYSLF